jgi:hypothetical protein
MKRLERLAAPERDIRNTRISDLPRHNERLGLRQLVIPSLVGPRFLAAGKATRAASVGQLPREEQRRTVLIDRASRTNTLGAQVKRM